MNGLVQSIILTIVVGACTLAVIIGVIKTIGIEYRKSSDHASESVLSVVKDIPRITQETIKVIDTYEKEKEDKKRQKEWEDYKKSGISMKSVKDDSSW